VFPMSETLRYHLPFRSPEETETYLRSLAEKRPGGLIVFGDDGEKFGVWPGTYATCYEKGWLRSFLEMLRRNREWLRAVTFSQWLDGHESAGLAYLPTLTYPEMMEWALPAERWGEYRRSREVLREQMSYPGSPTFLRGGYWRSFLAKYPESYRMYRKMLDVRGRLEDADPEGTAPGLAAAWQDYWRAQCNCAYWHGVFGGLYLKHLRTEIYRRLISAESAAEEVLKKGGSPVRSRVVDVDGDRHPEVALLTPDLTLWVAPRRGGTLFELDFKPSSYNLFAALARRREGYHDDLRRLVQAREAAEEGGTRSIHDRVEAKEEGLENYLVYDRALADSGADHFLDPAVTLRDLREDRFEEKGDFAGAAFEILRGPTAGSLVLGRPGEVRTPSGPRAVRVTKTVSVEGRSGFRLAWEIEAGPEGVEGVLFGTRFYVALSDPAIPECYVLVDGKRPDPDRLGSEGDTRGGGSLTLVDRVIPVQVDLECPGARLVRYPVYTVSLSEGGFEKSYQSSVVAPLWEVRLAPGGKLRAEVRVSVSVPVAVEEASAGKVGSE
jgi:hypothetical protein